MLFIRVTFWDLVLIGVGVGVVLGLIPLILGFVKGRRNLGIYGFVASIIGGGAISSVLSLIIVVVFVWLILKKPIDKKPVETTIENNETR